MRSGLELHTQRERRQSIVPNTEGAPLLSENLPKREEFASFVFSDRRRQRGAGGDREAPAWWWPGADPGRSKVEGSGGDGRGSEKAGLLDSATGIC